MSETNVFENIENVLLRIEEIKRRFGVRDRSRTAGAKPQVFTPADVPGNGSFERVLETQTDATGKSASAVERSSEAPRGPRFQSAAEPQLSFNRYDDIIEAASDEFRIPQPLIRAVIQQESGFDSSAVSKKGAMGLMQLMPDTAQVLGVEDPYDARQNIFGGTRYLNDLLEFYGGNLNRALAAYNAGPHRVGEEIPYIPETRNFVESVIRYYDDFSRYTDGEVE
jgi:soluble lytic murein transglycosylase-like protein